MTIEELDYDEHFDISVLTAIQTDIIVYLGQPRVPAELVRKLVNVIQNGSRLYVIDDQDDHRINGVAGGEDGGDQAARGSTGTIVPVMRETFAYAALRCLFALCSGNKEGGCCGLTIVHSFSNLCGMFLLIVLLRTRSPRCPETNRADRRPGVVRTMRVCTSKLYG